MDIFAVFKLLGGIGLFLYGMSLLGTSLEKIAGAGLERTLEKLTNNRLKGLALGTVVTGVIQSSAATTVMLVGFVNAGIMKFAQTVPVIMGANIGTTVTGQILRLGDLSGSQLIFELIKPTTFAPIVIAIGSFMILISKRRKTRDIAHLLIGFGILFFGMTTMESALAPLKDSEAFQEIFFMFKNPLLGVLLGAVVTAILQSSSASVGILQAIASTGTVTFSMAAPIIIGQNIGKCITVLIASIGTNKNAKRVVVCHLMINIIGAILFLIGIYGFQTLVGFSFWESPMTRGNIADFHTLFNIATSILLLPFCNVLVAISKKILKEDAPSRADSSLALLDDIFLDRPTVALEQCRKLTLSMGETVQENYDMAVTLLQDFDEKTFEKLNENEAFLDKCETALGEYLVRITSRNIRREDQKEVAALLHSVGDLERIGDHCVNIAEVGQFNKEQGITFSKKGLKEIKIATEAVKHVLTITLEAYQKNDLTAAYRVEPLEEVIDLIKETLKVHHIERLSKGGCSVQAGISLTEFLTSAERISDHCSNIALHIIEKLSNMKDFDSHEYQKLMHRGTTEEYKALYRYYESKYYDPIK
ncbi:Na/Pi cotransporter family protein [Fusibacillus kribbianus]|uniref:Na/Pi cotransporter family protein n=1 Tax=Fusibacillus kribbianus TaxID=3044208 RepID=A0AAP4B9W1_9FIRM|nr:Na/Pi cotransporter family protein [Ruminococcus sp. YH-rum2234]MDI9242384.1 Na/Pi cotransporter family protein [Ruminococcus sp. YH-rum2234]